MSQVSGFDFTAARAAASGVAVQHGRSRSAGHTHKTLSSLSNAPSPRLTATHCDAANRGSNDSAHQSQSLLLPASAPRRGDHSSHIAVSPAAQPPHSQALSLPHTLASSRPGACAAHPPHFQALSVTHPAASSCSGACAAQPPHTQVLSCSHRGASSLPGSLTAAPGGLLTPGNLLGRTSTPPESYRNLIYSAGFDRHNTSLLVARMGYFNYKRHSLSAHL